MTMWIHVNLYEDFYQVQITYDLNLFDNFTNISTNRKIHGKIDKFLISFNLLICVQRTGSFESYQTSEKVGGGNIWKS